MNLSKPEFVFIFDGRSGPGPKGKSSKRRPAVRQFMVELKAAAMSAPAPLGIVSPHACAIKPILSAKGTGGPARFNHFRIFSIDQRFDISLLCALGIDCDSVHEDMLASLEFDRAATGVCSVRGDCIIAVVCPI